MIRILQQDNRVTKAIFAIIIGAAILTMVITLVPGIFDNGTANDASAYATIRTPGAFGKFTGDTTVVKMDDVRRAAMQQLRQQGYPEFYLPFLLPRIGQQKVMTALLQREADRLGLKVGDEEVRQYMMTGQLGQMLYPNGKFIGDAAYVNFAEMNNMSTAQLEDAVRGDIQIGHLRDLIAGGVTVSDAAVRKEYMEQGTKVKFDYAVLASADLKKTINPSDSDLQAFFKTSSARYATAVPEQRKITFFAFDDSNLPGGKPAISDADAMAYYNANQAQYKSQEQVQTRHILITVAKDADAKTDAAAKAKAADILKQVKAGGNFAELAKKNSDDPGSKDKGGELPMIPTGNLDPAYAKAAMALSPGQTSDLVRSSFGYHIIQTIAKQPAAVKSFAEVKAGIVTQLQTQKAGSAATGYATSLAAEAKKNGLQKTADAHGLHVVTTDFVPQGGVIASLPDGTQLLTAAFAAAKDAAPAYASTGEGYAVFQVTDIKAAHAPEFADWKSHLLDDYREQKAPELLNTQLQKLADRAKVLNDVKKAAAEFNATVKTSELVGRDDQVPDLGALSGPGSVLFSLPKGGISGPINNGATGAVAQLIDKQEPSADDIAKNLPATREKMKEQQQGETFQVFAGSLLDRYTAAGSIIYSKSQDGPQGPGAGTKKKK